MKYLILVDGDMNDADMKLTSIWLDDKDKDDKKALEIIKKGAKLVKEYSDKYPHTHNWMDPHHMDKRQSAHDFYAERMTQEELDWFVDYMPSTGSDYPVHSIREITLIEIGKTQKLL